MDHKVIHIAIFQALVGISLSAQNGQMAIDRVEQMGTSPKNYFYKDWKSQALLFDRFVYDTSMMGQHLPLIFMDNQGTNYSDHPTFGLHTYVGTRNSHTGEAICVLPSLIGATLCGVDKHNGAIMSWVTASQDYFNRQNNQNIYLNNPAATSGQDWWYDLMPNVFFYQLYDLYGPIGDYATQFTQVADQFYTSVTAMGGDDKPWKPAEMNYRAWNFLTHRPNSNGVIEPEAAGAYAYILYHAYKELKDKKYLAAAEWSMEFLDQLDQNPSYELQLPYGAYMAAKMNAEIGTNYNVEKLVNWCFEEGPLRGWGSLIGDWSDIELNGLIGETAGRSDYAFQLNGFQQAAALVPLCRYDKRFCLAIAKWMLHLSNNCRYFYPDQIADSLQDSDAWSRTYDPESAIGYEGIRLPGEDQPIYATGDAIHNDWATTNLSLYSSASVGYLGSMIQPTSEDKILLIDLIKTDFFANDHYPSYMLYNPYDQAKIVTIDIGGRLSDIYEVTREVFTHHNVSGIAEITIPANEVASIVIVPSDAVATYQQDQLLLDGVVVDYKQTRQLPSNYPPRIKAFAVSSTKITATDSLHFFLETESLDEDTTYYDLYIDGLLADSARTAKHWTWIAPDTSIGNVWVQVIAYDEHDARDTADLTISILPRTNQAPQITRFNHRSLLVEPDGRLAISADVLDEDTSSISYSWTSDGGLFLDAEARLSLWKAPTNEGVYNLSLEVQDNSGLSSSKTLQVLVRGLTTRESTQLIAHYPFSGNAQDHSPNQLDGRIRGPKLTIDRHGARRDAYFFDGKNDHISVGYDPVLDVQEGIGLCLWFKMNELKHEESFLISHGSWQNRWKLSISPQQKLRWSLKTDQGQVRDLDSRSVIQTDEYYHVCVDYDGQYMTLYLNDTMQAFAPIQGPIKRSMLDLEIGQMLPDNQDFNFSGIIDDIKIYDYALHPNEVNTQYKGLTTSTSNTRKPRFSFLLYPNPCADKLLITSPAELHNHGLASYRIYSPLGIEVLNGRLPLSNHIDTSTLQPGLYHIQLFTMRVSHTMTFFKL